MKYLLLLFCFVAGCSSKPTWAKCVEQCNDIGRGFDYVRIDEISGDPYCMCSGTIDEQVEAFKKANGL